MIVFPAYAIPPKGKMSLTQENCKVPEGYRVGGTQTKHVRSVGTAGAYVRICTKRACNTFFQRAKKSTPLA